MMDRNDNFSNIKHLCNRSGFGITYDELQKLSKKKVNKIAAMLLKKEQTADLIVVTPEEFNTQQLLLASLGARKDYTPEEKQQRQRITRTQNLKSRQLNIDWMLRMMDTENPLLEKMTLFWHGHFACRTNNPYFSQQLNNIQRKYALGNFKDLLIAVSQSPAMLQYLNNQQNRKGKPNENFARELMELFTLGRGNYTENDIKASARSFTGWMYNKQGQFEFNNKVHDEGEKTFFGKTGAFDGEAIIDMILEKPAAASFICRKLYLFFVNDTANEAHIAELAAHLYQQKYDIRAVMEKMFTADWFYSKENVGNKIKSPAEFLVGLSRSFFVTYNKPQVLIQLETSLGQYLFNPPNVAGWSGGRSWIDSSSLMLRMKIPSMVLNDGILDFNGKADPEDEALIALNRKEKSRPIKSYINAKAAWPRFIASLPAGISPAQLAEFLLATPVAPKIESLISHNTNPKNTAIAVTSMPEYQLC